MYHGIVSKEFAHPPDRETGADLYDVSKENFYAQMSFLKENKIDAVITFDDGELNNRTVAFPILKELGLKGFFFIIVKRVGRLGYMDWPHLKELIDAGMTVGSHGLTHEILTNLIDSQIEQELSASKSNLEMNLGVTIKDISIPRGFCNEKILGMGYAAGYKNIYVSNISCDMKSPCIARIAVKGNWTLKRFQMALENKVPAKEKIFNGFKHAAKLIFRESGYNFIRKTLLK